MSNGKRIGRSAYWLRIVVLLVGILISLGFAFGAFISGNFAVALLCVALLLPAGIYYRVVQMRRCRDIGWPAFLPWAMFGVQMLFSLGTLGSLGSISDPAQLVTGSAVSLAVSLADFVFMVVIGCLAGQADSSDDPRAGFGGSVTLAHSGGAPAMGVAGSDGHDPFEDAIARAMDNYRRTGSAAPDLGQSASAPPVAEAAAQPAMPPRVAGFGRKAV